MFKKIITCLLAIVLLVSVPALSASAYEIEGFSLDAHTALLISLDTGETVFSQNAEEKVYPASLTKILSAIVMIENTEDFDKEIITYTKEANDEILGTGSVVVGLKIGEQFTAKNALYGLLVSSGGDVAYAIAHHYGGSTEGFMKMMNDKAAEIGLENSHFGNPVGLHDEATYTTGADISRLVRYALKYDLFKEVTSSVKYTFPATNMSEPRQFTSTNFLINPNTNYYYAPAKGIKTGFTDEAGRCVVSTASQNGYNYLCVIMGCKNADGKRNEFLDSANIYRWAFEKFEQKTVFDSKKPVTEIKVNLSLDTDHVSLFAKEELLRILPKADDPSKLTINPKLKQEEIDAPVEKGAVLVTAEVLYEGKVIGEVDLIAGESVSPSTILIIGRGIKNFFTSTAFKIIIAVIAVLVLAYIGMIIKLNSRKKRRRRKKSGSKHGK